MKKRQNTVCDYIFYKEQSCTDHRIASGTRWEDVSDNFACPECDAGKDVFELVK